MSRYYAQRELSAKNHVENRTGYTLGERMVHQ